MSKLVSEQAYVSGRVSEPFGDYLGWQSFYEGSSEGLTLSMPLADWVFEV